MSPTNEDGPSLPHGDEACQTRIFIGHGRSPAWLVLEKFLHQRLDVECDEFNRTSAAGKSTQKRLSEMLDVAGFAFLVLTGEDSDANGQSIPRMNVVHEVGLFQGRLGFEKAIVLLEEGCEEFSNIAGMTQIRFSKNRIDTCFEEVRRVLERECVIESR